MNMQIWVNIAIAVGLVGSAAISAYAGYLLGRKSVHKQLERYMHRNQPMPPTHYNCRCTISNRHPNPPPRRP